MTNNDLFTEDTDSSIDISEVAAFLAEQNEQTEEVTPERVPGEIPEDIKAMLEEGADDSEEVSDSNSSVELPVDAAFDNNKKNLFDRMTVNVLDTEVPITEEDKAMYLKCVLHSRPVELAVTAPNGISGKCRSLSVYEGDVAATAFTKFLSSFPDTAIGFHEGIIQQFRLSMQLVEFCGNALEYLEYKRGVNGSISDHADDLLEKSKIILDVPAPVYDIYVRIMNVYQHKLYRLNNAAFNSDFWSPAGTD